MTQATQVLTDAWLTQIAEPTKKTSLYSLHDAVKRIELDGKSELKFGRTNLPEFISSGVDPTGVKFLAAISREHFLIKRLLRDDNCSYSYVLKDVSRFGTFVNGKKVPPPKSEVPLQSGDTIGLHPRFPLYLFFDENEKSADHFPSVVTEQYVVARKLGAGACGEVFLAYERGSGVDHRFAIKCVSKRKFRLSSVANLQNGATPSENVKKEVEILRGLSHPCIVMLEKCVETDETLYIVMEHVAGGELFDRLVERIESHHSGFDEPVAKLLFFQLVHSVAYLHSHAVTHRDLKPENVLLSSTEDETLVKLTDFGLSKMVDTNTILRTFCGTPQYVAPEVLRTNGDGEYSPVIDCWSLGVILFTMLGGYPPFTTERKDRSLRDQILAGSYAFPKDYWSNVSSSAIDLIRSLLTVDPARRISARAALQHVWFDDAVMKEKVSQLMKVSVSQLLDVGGPSAELYALPTGFAQSHDTACDQHKSTSLHKNSSGEQSDAMTKAGESLTDSDSLGDLRQQFAVSRIASRERKDAPEPEDNDKMKTRARTRAEHKRPSPPDSRCEDVKKSKKKGSPTSAKRKRRK